MSIGGNIRRIRLEKNMTQAELSKAINIHSVTLSNWEGDKRDPGATYMEKIAEALGCEVAELFDK